jgi:hypothetical protein
MAQERAPASFTALSEDRRAQAMARLAVLRPHLDDGVPLTRTAAAAGVPQRVQPSARARRAGRRLGTEAAARLCRMCGQRSPYDGHAGFHASKLYSVRHRLSDMVREFLEAKGDPELLKKF